MEYRQPFKGDYGISQYFGEKITDPKGHTGIDYLCPIGTPILASEAGTVIKSGWDTTGYGWCVILMHPDNKKTIYAHLSVPPIVKVGEKVQKGQVIGYSGTSGNSTGAHLHFEMRNETNTAIDPMPYLHTYSDAVPEPVVKPDPPAPLMNADQLGKDVEVTCPLGAKAWNKNFTSYDVFPQGTELTYTGQTQKHNGYTFCEVYPAPRTYWVAVNDGVTQILENRK
jgi:hypothetical protein